MFTAIGASRHGGQIARSVVALGLTLHVVLPDSPVSAQSRAEAAPPAVSTIGNDERIVFFTTAAHLSPDRMKWIVPIHARIYRPERSAVVKAVFAKALETGYGIAPSPEQRLDFDARIDLLLGDNKGGRRIVVAIAGKSYTLPRSGKNGHVHATLEINAAGLTTEAQAGRAELDVRLAGRDPRAFKGTVLLIAPRGRSIISDIDDTVKVTHVTDRKRMMQATFLYPFEAFPGTARAYQAWTSEGAALHFVSSSPWHLYEPLATFLTRAGFPPATITLKQIRLKDRSALNIFADSTVTKPPEIEKLLQAFPERTFVLIGDNGEKDPEIYADFMRRYPERIERILIRSVFRSRTDDARLAKVFAGIDPGRWQVFADASELPRTLGR